MTTPKKLSVLDKLALMNLAQLVSCPPRLVCATPDHSTGSVGIARLLTGKPTTFHVEVMFKRGYRRITREPKTLRQALLILRQRMNQYIIQLFDTTEAAIGDPDADLDS